MMIYLDGFGCCCCCDIVAFAAAFVSPSLLADRPSTQFILGDVTVASAYACDPYVILVLTDASLRLVTGK